MKKIWKLLLSLLVLSTLCVNVFAQNTTYVYDEADLFTSEEENELSEKIEQLVAKHNMDFVIVTTDDTNGLSSQDYADDYYDYNDYKEDGILLLYDMDNREIYVSTKGLGITYLTDYGREEILDYIWDDITNGNYASAANDFLSYIDEYMTSGEEGEIIDIYNEEPEFGMFNIGIALVGALIITALVRGILNKQLKSVSTQHFARNYVVKNSFNLTGYSNFFVRKTVNKTPRPKDEDHHHSGGSSTHTSSSGSSHGGGGRSF